MQRFELPASRDKLACQPVEQLGVGGSLAQPAEIAGGADQAATEVILPDPVDDHFESTGDCQAGSAIGPKPTAARSIGERPGLA